MRQPTFRNLILIAKKTSKAIVLYLSSLSTLAEGQTLGETVQHDLKKCYEQHKPSFIRSIFAPDGIKPKDCSISEIIYPSAYKKVDLHYTDKTTFTDKDFRGALDLPTHLMVERWSESDKPVDFTVRKGETDENNKSKSLSPPMRGYTRIQAE